jgi:hypothetical protein
MSTNGTPSLIPDNFDRDTFHTPSVVYIGSKAAIVGSMAETLIEQNPDLMLIRFFKRYLGQEAPIFLMKKEPRGTQKR